MENFYKNLRHVFYLFFDYLTETYLLLRWIFVSTFNKFEYLALLFTGLFSILLRIEFFWENKFSLLYIVLPSFCVVEVSPPFTGNNHGVKDTLIHFYLQ